MKRLVVNLISVSHEVSVCLSLRTSLTKTMKYLEKKIKVKMVEESCIIVKFIKVNREGNYTFMGNQNVQIIP